MDAMVRREGRRVRKASYPAPQHVQRARRVGAWRGAIMLAALLAVMASVAGCGGVAPTARANPPASKLGIAVTVLDHENLKHAPSDTSTLAIRLSLQQSGAESDIYGTDAQTLVCDGVAMRLDLSRNLDDPYDGEYIGSVQPQTDQYTCVYSWSHGAEQALLAIPVLIPDVPRIQTPARRAIVQTPGAGSPGLSLTYAPANFQFATVTATASDFNQRTATSAAGADGGEITIATSAFPTLFSVGWGSLTLTRSSSAGDLRNYSDNAAFAKVSLDFEQVDTIPVFWE